MLPPNPEPLNPKGKYLIVNADDYNTDSERNRGILEAVSKGIVTSVSVLANMPCEENTLTELKNTLGPRIGIHLNLTRGKPLCSGLKTLTHKTGYFFTKQTAWRKALLGLYDLQETEKELSAQIEHLMSSGMLPDHMDGNNHIHVFPGIATVVARLAKQYRIRKVRLPLEAFSFLRQYGQPNALKKYFIGLLAKRARPIFKNHGLCFTEHFAGIQFPAVANTASLRAFLQTLPQGVTELMCHPGFKNYTRNPFSTEEREQELYSLTHQDVLEDIRRLNINLISYSELVQ
jgi:predicted glycoside hydrolase/deacetylase ChbG (UPF0249 family)